MFGMGGTEILVILVVAMIFLGPEKLPEAAAKISKGIRDIRKQSRELQNTIENDTEIGGAIRDLKSALRGEETRRPPVRKMPPVEPVPALDAAAEAAATVAAAEAELAGAAAAAPAVSAEASAVDPEAGAIAGATDDTAAAATAPLAAAPLDAPLVAAAATATPPAELDPDDPLRLIRPATGTAKRDHG